MNTHNNIEQLTIVLVDVPDHNTSNTLAESVVDLNFKGYWIVVRDEDLGTRVKEPRGLGGLVKVANPRGSGGSRGREQALRTEICPLPDATIATGVLGAVWVLPVGIVAVTKRVANGAGLELGSGLGHILVGCDSVAVISETSDNLGGGNASSHPQIDTISIRERCSITSRLLEGCVGAGSRVPGTYLKNIGY